MYVFITAPLLLALLAAQLIHAPVSGAHRSPPGLDPAGTLVPLSMCGSMALVELPRSCLAAARAAEEGAGAVAGAAAAAGGASSADAKWVQDSLHYGHAIECPVKCVCGRLYVRISGEAAGHCLPGAQHGQCCPGSCCDTCLHHLANISFLCSQPTSTTSCPITSGWRLRCSASRAAAERLGKLAPLRRSCGSL